LQSLPAHRIRGAELIDPTKLEYDCSGGNSQVTCATLHPFADMETKELMEAGMVRFCGPIPYRATILEDAYVLVLQPPDTKVLVKEILPELTFLCQQQVTHLE